MSKIIFARTRHHYDSYRDFLSLVELSGFDWCYIDEIDISKDVTYIWSPTNGEQRPHIDNEKKAKPKVAKLIWWNLERGYDIGGMDKYCDEMWVSDRHYATFNPHFKFVPMGSHPGLRLHAGDLPKVYDYCHISYKTGRRDHIYSRLNHMGLKEAPNGWFEERDKSIRSSHIMVNVHQDDYLIGEPLRVALAAAYSLPIISETITDSYPLVNGEHLLITSFNDLPRFVSTKLHDKAALAKLGSQLHNKLCIENSFRSFVEEAVK